MASGTIYPNLKSFGHRHTLLELSTYHEHKLKHDSNAGGLNMKPFSKPI